MSIKGLINADDPLGDAAVLEIPQTLGVADQQADLLDPGEAVVLALSDLVPDEHGEVVLFNDAEAPVMIAADLPVIASGLAEPHVTAAGIDVTGMHFSSFETGITVYHDPDIPLTFG